jgi:sterol desaturase/sphingolipid hydroxylase (fatty acid hydroxylase superfamily)
MGTERQRVLAWAMLGFAAAGAMSVLLLRILDVPLNVQAIVEARSRLIDAVVALLPWPDVLAVPLRPVLHDIALAPDFLAPTALILLLERLYPARPEQRVLSTALVQDFVWRLAQLAIFAWIIGWFAGLLGGFYDRRLAFLTVQAVDRLPPTVSLILAIVAADFLAWLHHVVRHKVRWCLWFHMIHHSQTRMNLWTDSRYHVVEYFVAAVIVFLPVFAFKLGRSATFWLAWLMLWYPRLYHANIRSTFGVLRFVLVTPQSHRVHHSLLPQHQDKNFGVLFSVWDRVFGTQSPDEDVYPDTGVRAADFPHEAGWGSVLSLRAFAAQMIYPFRLVGRWMMNRAPGTLGSSDLP